MSYIHTTDGYVISFAGENNFLEARLGYLNLGNDLIVFADFLQSARSSGLFEIESIVREEPISLSFSGSSDFVIFDEDAELTFNPLPISTSHGDNVIISTTVPDNSFYNYFVNNASEGLEPHFQNSYKRKIGKKIEEKLEEIITDPIKSRFDILDL